MKHWNERVLRRVVDGVETFAVHEVYYDEDGQPTSCTTESVAPVGETLDILRTEFQRHLAACEQPVLDYDAIVARGETFDVLVKELNSLWAKASSLTVEDKIRYRELLLKIGDALSKVNRDMSAFIEQVRVLQAEGKVPEFTGAGSREQRISFIYSNCLTPT